MSHYVSSSRLPLRDPNFWSRVERRRDSRFTFIRDIVSYGFHDYLLNKPIHEPALADVCLARSLLPFVALYMAAPFRRL
jgi:hypothetical protein